MTITPTIIEVHERRYEFILTQEDIASIIREAICKAAGVDEIPAGARCEGGVVTPMNVSFAVPVEVEKTSDQILAGIESLTDAPTAAQEQSSRPELQISATSLPEGRVAPVDPIPAPVRPRAKTAPKPGRPAKWLDLSTHERSVVLHMEALPDTFAPSDDLRIAEGLTSGIKAPEIAAEMGVTPEEVVARWKAMWCHAVLEKSRTPTITGQARLRVALRYRVETEE